jgi:hypothetical protein
MIFMPSVASSNKCFVMSHDLSCQRDDDVNTHDPQRIYITVTTDCIVITTTFDAILDFVTLSNLFFSSCSNLRVA